METQAQKFTPGKWVIERRGNNSFRVQTTYGVEICEIDHWGKRQSDLTAELKPEGEPQANARLIAAAPELFEACSKLLPRTLKLVDALREMIKEARERNRAAGQTVFNPAALEVALEALEHDEDCSWPSGHCTCGISSGTTGGKTWDETVEARAALTKATGTN